MFGTQSFNQSYDFATVTSQLRLVQLLCLIIEVFLVHSESGNLSGVTFLVYSLLVVMSLLHVISRWYYNIDGRYDLRQLIREDGVQKVPYAVALYVPIVLGFLCIKVVNLNEGMAGSLFHYSALVQILAAAMLIILEFYEIFVKSASG